MSESDADSMTQEQWRKLLMHGHPAMRVGRRFFGLLPSNPRCKVCNAPFTGIGGAIMSLTGRGQFPKNPNFCDVCIITDEVGGVEIELSMLFADVRGATSLAENMTASEFTRKMNRFFDAAMTVLVQSDAWVDKLVGDEVIALFIPGFAGEQHAKRALEAAQDLLRATGHDDQDGPWVPVGVGVHTGPAYVGLVGVEGGVSDLTAMGDAMNIASRLGSQAGPGEIIASEAACAAAQFDGADTERRRLELKGRSKPVDAHVLTISPD